MFLIHPRLKENIKQKKKNVELFHEPSLVQVEASVYNEQKRKGQLREVLRDMNKEGCGGVNLFIKIEGGTRYIEGKIMT